MLLEGNRTTVVFFVGGCTYSEIAALRWVGRQNRGMSYNLELIISHLTKLLLGRKFLVATTGIISGTGLVESIANVGKPAGTRA
jgi:hypothetical protein